jgi:hypothetical protein
MKHSYRNSRDGFQLQAAAQRFEIEEVLQQVVNALMQIMGKDA